MEHRPLRGCVGVSAAPGRTPRIAAVRVVVVRRTEIIILNVALASPTPDAVLDPRADVPRVRIMGVDFAAITARETVEHLVDGALDGAGCWVVTANLDHLRRFASDRVVRDLINEADLVVADGTPVVLASRLAGMPLPERVAGSSMIVEIAHRAAARGASLYLLGGAPTVAERAAVLLREQAPSLIVAGCHCPPFGFEQDPAEIAAIEHALVEAQPDVVLVALSFPKTDLLIERLRLILPATSFVGVGISLSFITGDVRRAPKLLQVAGLEWLHRVAQEPRRLWRRYLVDGLPFAARLLAAAIVARVQPCLGGPWYRHGEAGADPTPRIGAPSR